MIAAKFTKRSLVAGVFALTLFAHLASAQLPARLSDQEFWRLSSEFSEPEGTFHSENLVSNELRFQAVIPALTQTVAPGRAYVGVGSEQNFTYIAAVRPAMAFIVDIRRGNLDLHLIYKALFELSANRVEFVSKLFARKAPSGLTANSSAADIFAAFEKAKPNQALYDQTLKDIKTQLVSKHGFKLSKGDLDGIDFVYGAWFKYGPDIQYELTTGGGPRGVRGVRGGFRGGNSEFPTYAELMTATDGAGRNRSYLASEETFNFVKDLETRSLIVPVVGNFGGPKALRAVGAYLKQKGAVVSAFYVSNVEQYLREDGIWGNFCGNAATLPTDAASTFIRSARGGFAGQLGGFGGRGGRGIVAPTVGGGFNLELAPMKPDLTSCPAAR
jgi:hypothetical protein